MRTAARSSADHRAAAAGFRSLAEPDRAHLLAAVRMTPEQARDRAQRHDAIAAGLDELHELAVAHTTP